MKNFKTFITEGVNDPGIFKAIYICGPAGAGKSYISKKVCGGMGLRVVNSDDTFEHMLKKAQIEPDFDKMSPEEHDTAQDIRKQSRRIMFRKKESLIDNRLGMIIDTPGTKVHFIGDDKWALESLGYEVMMIFVAVKMATAKERNANRERKIPSAALETDYKSIMGNLKAFQLMFSADRFILINGDEVNQTVLDAAWKKVNKFVNEPVTNRRAVKWIQKQQYKKTK